MRAFTRRRFLRRAAGAAAGLLVLEDPRRALGTQANSKLAVALIGVGGRGTWFVDTIPRMERVVAVCDVNEKKEKKWADFAGAAIVGTKGLVHATGHNASFRLIPEDRFRGIDREGPKTLEPSRGHEADWFIACRGGKPAWASFEYAVPLNEFLMLGNVATAFEGKFEYDPVEGKVVDHPEADRALRAEYRAGWSL